MKKGALSLLFSLVLASFLCAQQKPVPYAAYWKRAEKHELDQLPKSAAAVVDTIYTLAKKHQHNPQLIKALLYQSKFTLIAEEEAQLKIIRHFKREIAESQYPAKNILESMLAKLYWQYYQQNRYRFYDRSHTENKVDAGDFRTWDLQTLFNEIHVHFQKSLEQASAAQKTDLTTYNVLLESGISSKDYRPTLYDFLAQHALEFYSSSETSINRPAQPFKIEDSHYFTDALHVGSGTNDSLSLQLHALKIFRDLIIFHQHDAQPTALAKVKLERLQFLRRYAAIPEKEALYLEALHALKDDYEDYEVSSLIDFEIASFHFKQGDRYQAGGPEDFRFEKARALEICRQAIARYPESFCYHIFT